MFILLVDATAGPSICEGKMLPELAVVYVSGLPVSAALTGLHSFLFRRKMRSTRMLNVQNNLRSIDMFWSDSESKIKPFTVSDFEKDQSAYYRTVIILGIVCFFLSWAGFALQLLVMASIRYFAMPRLERKVFASSLAEKTLSPNEAKSIVTALQTTH